MFKLIKVPRALWWVVVLNMVLEGLTDLLRFLQWLGNR